MNYDIISKNSVRPLFNIRSLDELVESGRTIDEIIEEVTQLDFCSISKLDSESSGSHEQWKSILEAHRQTISFVTAPGNRIVAYWQFLALRRDCFDKAVNGEMEDSEITLNHIKPMSAPGLYDLYIPGVVIHGDYRCYTIGRKLYGSFLKMMQQLKRQNMRVRSICANVLTEDGRMLADGLGLKRINAHKRRGEIYFKTCLAPNRRKQEVGALVMADGATA